MSLATSAGASWGEITKVQRRRRGRRGRRLGNRLVGFQGFLITRESLFILFVLWFFILLIYGLLVLFIFIVHWFLVARQLRLLIAGQLRLLISRQVVWEESLPRANCFCLNCLLGQSLPVALPVAVSEHSGVPRGLERESVNKESSNADKPGDGSSRIQYSTLRSLDIPPCGQFRIRLPCKKRIDGLIVCKKVIDGGGWWHLKGAAGQEPAPVPAPRQPDSEG